jgi:fibronectin-binding autotransporter adhesin
MASRSRSHQRFPRPAVRPIGNTRSRSQFRPSFLVLEPRTMLSTFQVTNTNDSGTGSLRYELSQAADGDTINFASSLFSGGQHQSITLTSGPLDITKNVSIQGPAANVLTIDGNHKSTVMTIGAGTDVTVAGLTMADGQATSGGAIENFGKLTFIRCAISGNTAKSGGAIENYSAGALYLDGCTLSKNTATNRGGGAIESNGLVGMYQSTVAYNSAYGAGGGILSYGSLLLDGCTVSGNSGRGAGGIVNNGSATTLDNTIVAANPGGDLFLSFPSSGSNNLIGGSPQLGQLAYNGGPTETMAPLSGSPAIGAGDTSVNGGMYNANLTQQVDQRGVPRIRGGKLDIGAVESGPTTITVNSMSDTGPGPIIDGSSISFRQAVGFGAVDPYGDTITFAAGLTGTIALAQGALPAITTPQLTIGGPGASLLTIDAQGQSGILSIDAGANVSITGLTLAHGSASRGGAIENQGTLTLTACTVSGSSATVAGGIDNPGTLTLNACTVSGNSSHYGGGGLYNDGTGAMTLTGCTLSGNTARGGGGAILNASTNTTLTLTGCTVWGNTAAQGGGIDNSGGSTVTINAGTVASNSAALKYGGGGIDNLGTMTLSDLTVSGNSSHYGGGGIENVGTMTLNGVIVASNSATTNGGGILNESTNAILTMTGCTLSGNMAGAGGNILSEGATLTMTGCIIKTGNASIYGGGLLNDGSAELVACAIYGNVAPKVRVGSSYYGTGGGIVNESFLKLTACTVSGNGATLEGGGICNIQPTKLGKYHLGYSLAMYDCSVSDNKVAAYGGGIENGQNFSLSMLSCTISGNSAVFPEVNGQVLGTGKGGGIHDAGTLTMTNCTVYGNYSNNGTVDGRGGGIYSTAGTSGTLSNCTIASNKASATGDRTTIGGDISLSGFWTLNNCIISGSASLGGDIAFPNHANYCFMDDPTSANGFLNSGHGNVVASGGPLLSALNNWGGLTETMVPGPGSPVIGMGDPSLIPTGITTDERGAPRTQGGKVDIGAVEAGPTTITVTTLADNVNLPLIDGSVTTLREAIDYANADPYSGDTITFAPGLTGTIALAQGALPAITTAGVTIVGPGANVMTINAQGNSRILSINPKAAADISELTLADGSASSGGAIINHGALGLADCVLSDNTATGTGGAIDNGGTLAMTGCTLSGDTAHQGGAVYNYGTLTVANSTLSANKAIWNGTSAGTGGAVFNYGEFKTGSTLMMANCTIAGNSAYAGGGIYSQYSSTAKLSNCTVAGNSATFTGGIWNRTPSSNVTLDNSIVAENPGGDIFEPVTGSNNLIDDPATAGGFTNRVDGNIVGLDPKLGPLASNGGPTQTMALLAGSPAINAGDNALVPPGVTTDQRGSVRIKDGTVDIGAFESGPSIITVTSLLDSAGSGLTLRQAIDYVNEIDPQGGVTITFAAGLQGTVDLTQGRLPAIAGDLAIIGPGASLLTIDGQSQSGILFVGAGAHVIIAGLTLADGMAPAGGAIDNFGTLAMTDCTLSGNSATFYGGGLYNAGTLKMTRCTLSGNSATRSGGGLYSEYYPAGGKLGTATLTDCTFSGNTAPFAAGLELAAGNNTLADCTISANTGTSSGGLAAGMNIYGGGTTLENTIVAGNTGQSGASDLGGTATGSNNLIGTGSVSGSNNKLGVTNPMLGPLAWNGGPTQTMALLDGSPAKGAGAIALLPAGLLTDQRGAPRTKGGAVDIGAFESGPTTIVVTSLADVNSPAIDLFAPAGITLREAIAFAGVDPGGDTIEFSTLVRGSIELSLGSLPTITSSLKIDGPGADVLTIDAQGKSGILSIGSGANVSISGLTLANGDAFSAQKGGAVVNNGTLTLNECTLTGNTATNGGAIYNTGALTLTNSTLSANSAYEVGGAIDNPGSLSMTDCTISGNSAFAGGAAIYSGLYQSQPNNSLTLNGCTIARNSKPDGDAAAINCTRVTLNDTIVAYSGSGGDIRGTASGSNNLIDDASTVVGLSNGVNGNLLGVDPKLGPLAYYGGSTQTIALLSGSPAIGAGAVGSVTTDQRNFALDSPKPDIGAFQYQGTPPTVAINVSGQTTQLTQAAFTFKLTATDTADPNGPFTYTVDWNDGSVQTFAGAGASVSVTHAYAAANTYSPIVTVLDQQNRSSGPVTSAPVVVTALSTGTLAAQLTNSSVTLVASTSLQASTALDTINNAPPSAWSSTNSATISLVGSPVDITVDPTSPSAEVNIGEQQYNTINWSELITVNNPYEQGGSEGLTIAYDVLGLVACGFIVGAAGGAGLGVAGGALAGFELGADAVGAVVLTGVATDSILTGALTGLAVAVASSGYIVAGASPALIVDQGTVNASNGVFSTSTDSPTMVVRGGTLNLQDDLIAGNLAGSQPLVEVDGGTLVLGGPDGTQPDTFCAYDSAPFVHVTGTGMLIVEPGNTFDQISSDLTAQTAGATSVQLVSSAPAALPGQAVTFTATVTASGAPATDGSVEFFDHTTGTFLGTEPLSNGSAAIQATFNAFTAGDTIYATYLPTTGALAPSSGNVAQAVVAATQTAVTGPSTTPTYGQTVTFTATVTDTNTPSGGTPTGSVEFYDLTTNTDLGPGTALSGSGNTVTSTFQVATLTAGTHQIEAVYTPTGAFQATSDTLSQTLNPASQTINFTAPASPLTFVPSETVTLSATGGDSGNPVVFTIDSSSTGAGSISGHTLTVTSAGTFVLDANQAGNTNYSAAPQVQETLVVIPANQTINFTAPASPISFVPNETVTLSATGGGSGNPVVFTIDSSSTGTGSISGHTLTVTSAGTFVLDANQAGNTNYNAAPQVQQTLTVTPANTMTTLASSANPAVPGQAVTFTAIISAVAPGGGTPTGSVTFTSGGTTLGGVTYSVVDGNLQASVTTSYASAGSPVIKAIYNNADGNYKDSSNSLTQTVLAPGLFVSGTTLYIVGGSTSSDTASVKPAGAKNDGSTGLAISAMLNGVSSSGTFTQPFTAIIIAGYAGSDKFTLAPTLTLPATVTAGDGDDTVRLRAGNSIVILGNGKDKVLGGNGNDTVSLGDGNDNVTLGDGNDNVTVGNGNDNIQLGNRSDVVVEGNGNDSVTAGNGADLVVGGLGQHRIRLGNGNDILIDGSATVVNAGDSLRQILSDWSNSSSALVNKRLKVVYNTTHPNVLHAGSGRNWFFYKNPPTTSNKKPTDFWTSN